MMMIESGWNATSAVLDGEANAVRGGWECVGHGKTLFVPSWMAARRLRSAFAVQGARLDHGEGEPDGC